MSGFILGVIVGAALVIWAYRSAALQHALIALEVAWLNFWDDAREWLRGRRR